MHLFSAPPVSTLMDRQKIFAAISGLIGAGKTTLAKKLAKAFGVPFVPEPVKENVYLEDFYSNMARYSFEMQIWLLTKRFKQQQMVIWSNDGAVSDRSIYEDQIFAEALATSGLMDERAYQTYMELFGMMEAFMKPPTLIIHLDVSPEESLRRIEQRARECESGITLEYLQSLHEGYQRHIEKVSKTIPVIVVPWEEFQDTDTVVEHVLEEFGKLSMRRTVTFTGDGPSA